ncbi:MAG: MBG domain-containing protein, partial [Lachnospiraceae bacterium]|nr:MBG domain-containing protein [Lachnospiraceae bacterium]
TGYITDGKAITVKIDKTAPMFSGENDGITINTNHWKTFLNTITFGKFFHETKTVNISATDNISDVLSCYYYIDTTGSTTVKTTEELNSISFTEGSSFSITEENKYIIYAYAVDPAGNRSTYICTEGIILDKTAPTVTLTAPAGFDLGDVYATATVRMNEAGTISYVVKSSELSDITSEAILSADDKLTVSIEEDRKNIERYAPITELQANKTYYMYAVGTDSAGNNSEVKSISFTTTKTQPMLENFPIITGTYGQKVSEMTISHGDILNGITGTWSASSTDVPSVDIVYAYQVVFTPDNTQEYAIRTETVSPIIQPRSLTAVGVTIGEVTGTYTYDGTEKEPKVTVIDTDATITESDYIYSYSENIDAGTATVTITGTKNYTGTVSRNFTIKKADEPNISYPTASGITYGQKLSESILTGGSTQYGSFNWEGDGDVIPSVFSGMNYATVAFTPNENTLKNYETVRYPRLTIGFPVEKATPSISITQNISGNEGNRSATFSVVVNYVGSGHWPTGIISFQDCTDGNATLIPDAQTIPMTGSQTDFTWTGLQDKVYKIKVVYHGDDEYHSVTSEEIEVDTRKQNQSPLTIDKIETKAYGDEAFTLSTTGGSGNGVVSFTSSNPNIVSISGTMATIHQSGTVTITATKAEDSIYNHVSASVSIIIAKKALEVVADNKLNVIKGSRMPELTYTVTGLVGTDAFTNPTITTSATDTGSIGSYDILISGGTLTNADNYNLTYTNGSMTVVPPNTNNDQNNAGNGTNTNAVVGPMNVKKDTEPSQVDFSDNEGFANQPSNEIGTGTDQNRSRNAQEQMDQQTENGESIEENQPYLAGDNGNAGWETIMSVIESDMQGAQTEPEMIMVNMNGASTIPAAVIASLRGKNTNLVLDLGDGITWTINGMDVSDEQLSDIDLGVTIGTSLIPEELINRVRGENESIQIELAHNGAFGFGATLNIAFDEQEFGKFASLFYYNEETGELEFMESVQIGEDGTAAMTFVHASVYTIVLSSAPMDESMVTSGVLKNDNQVGDDTEISPVDLQATDETYISMKIIWTLIGMILVVAIGGTLIYRKMKHDGIEDMSEEATE